MIAKRFNYGQSIASLTMLRSSSPAPPRSSSPAGSEISVGSPSPPPTLGIAFNHTTTAFRPLYVKRVRLTHEQQRCQTPTVQAAATLSAPTVRRKSSAERMKSFSIADILGKKDEVKSPQCATATAPSAAVGPLQLPTTQTLLPVQLLNERLQPPPPQLLLDVPSALTKVVHPWDPVRGPMPLNPFFPPALLHYEQRLAWDYQRQLQEHFHVQAQLLRQMSMDPTIIPSEDGSERSRSSSTGSDCCSPEVNASSATRNRTDPKSNSEAGDDGGNQQPAGPSSENSKKSAGGDTPLDALFQLSTKNFDEEQDPATLNIFATRPNPKKKRKSRTAFTNHQIFELERRFLYQKYLSPADRDEIAAGLGLSNAQVITWFQNRRAKLKRDMEELKKDVESVKQLPDQPADISPQQQHQRQRQQQYHQLQLQLQQQQQQHQHMATTINPYTMPYPPQPHALPLRTEAEAEAAAAATQSKQAKRVSTTNSTAAEDKQELKMLKMMTLMYYSGEAAAIAGSGSGSGSSGASNGSSDVVSKQWKLRSN